MDWPESIKLSQRNWIGKSEGAQIKFSIDNNKSIEVFTTRPDTIFGATYLVLAPEHPYVNLITTQEFRKSINQYVEEASKKSDLERQENEKNKTKHFTGDYEKNTISK